MTRTAVPKYVIRLLERRQRLALDLMCVSGELDRYCEKIGIDLGDPDACLLSDVRIYQEFDGAYDATLNAIKKALGIGEESCNA